MMTLLSTPHGRIQLRDQYLNGLCEDTIPFWFPRGIDTEHRGYLHCVDRDGSLVDSDKSIWAQGRMSWMLLTLYNTIEQKSEWLEWGMEGLEFLAKHGFDSDGRMFFHVARDGKPIRKRRYAYSEAFAAIAWAASARARGCDQSAKRAEQLFDTFVHVNFTPGVMEPKYTDVRPMIGLAPRMITIAVAQELRANLGESTKWNRWIDRCIEEIETLFVKPEQQVVLESVSPNGDFVDHFDGRLLNPGHAMEGAWFIMLEGEIRKEPRWIELGSRMLEWMWARGWDEELGGLYYFRDLYHKPIQEYWHDMKFWWPHNEAIIATLLAYELTGKSHFAEWHSLVHNWSYEKFGDGEHGEWFGYLHRDGTPSSTLKGNLWKSFFHFPRMQWFCGLRLSRS